jgi:tetratricopeptide (TPR) repeat protein
MMLPLLLVALAQQQPLPPNHPPIPDNPPQAQAAPDTQELMKRLDAMEGLKDKDKTFEVAASLGRLYYAHGRYSEAQTFLEQAQAKAKPAREQYAALVKQLGKKPVPPGCPAKPEDKLDQKLEESKQQAKTDPGLAASCLRSALHPLIEVETELGNVRFILHDQTGALAAFDSALELFDSNAEARYGRAAVLLDTKCSDADGLKAAKADFERFLKDYPTSPRAKSAKDLLARTDADIAAGNKCSPEGRAAPAVQANANEPMHPPMLSQDTLNALQNVKKSDAELDQTTAQAEDLLAHGKYQEALDTYKQVMPFRPDPRVRAGMAWTLNRMGKPMADNIWRVALADPSAIDALGDTLKAKGDEQGAKALWTKLKETAPEYASRLDSKLR